MSTPRLTTSDELHRLDVPRDHHPAADKLDLEFTPLTTEDCTVCGSATAVCRAPNIVNRRLYMHDACCRGCGLTSLDDILSSLRDVGEASVADDIEFIRDVIHDDLSAGKMQSAVDQPRFGGRTFAKLVLKYDDELGLQPADSLTLSMEGSWLLRPHDHLRAPPELRGDDGDLAPRARGRLLLLSRAGDPAAVLGHTTTVASVRDTLQTLHQRWEAVRDDDPPTESAMGWTPTAADPAIAAVEPLPMAAPDDTAFTTAAVCYDGRADRYFADLWVGDRPQDASPHPRHADTRVHLGHPDRLVDLSDALARFEADISPPLDD